VREPDPLGVRESLLEERYRIAELVGEGGSAYVYRATDEVSGSPVAVKFLHSMPEADDAIEQTLADFLKEAQLIRELSALTPAIVKAHGFGVVRSTGQPPLPFLVLEWLPGRSLDELLVGETNGGFAPRSLEESLRLLEPVALALALAHERGIVHRDVKPENMLVIGEGGELSIKLVDFGIAKVMQRRFAGLHHTGTAASAFTPHYGAPEQFSKTFGETGPWTDVFAMALVVLETMRGGRRAFSGDEFMELARQSCDEDRRPTPRTLGLEVPPEVDAVFARALAVQSSLRYDTMDEFWAALKSAAQRPVSQLPPRPLAPPAAEVREGGAVPSPRTRGRGLPILVGAVALGLAVIAVRAFVVGRSRGETERASGPSASPSATAGASGEAPVAPTSPSASADAPRVCPASAVVVPGGKLTLGDDRAGVRRASPTHVIYLDTFCLDRTEVTAEAYAECERGRGCSPPTRTAACADAHGPGSLPIRCVTWSQADTYCRSRGGRLPYEAETEHAARRGGALPWGDEQDAARANLADADPHPSVAPVGAMSASASKDGVLDLLGNVAEWQQDFFGPYGADEAFNPTGPATGTQRVIRGGSFRGILTLEPSASAPLSASHREAASPTLADPAIGFRCAFTLAAR
jgi:formylglycine-generating enzyme required for sulfatase activity